jgi:D-alanyl-D-alanine-carboxypeptidase/D-alanyl-D-alanine-endopeptidase
MSLSCKVHDEKGQAMHVSTDRRRRVITLLLTPLIGALATRPARAAGSSDKADAVTALGAAYMADRRAVGLSIGIIWGGQSSSHHFGTVDQRQRRVATDRTIYPIASLTKTMTGMLLAQAQLAGKLQLTDDIRRYLDGVYPNLEFDGEPIRLHHLVNHVSGLPRLLPDSPEAAPGFKSTVPYPERLRALAAASTRAGLYAALKQVKLTARPGTQFAYSNAAAQLAGDILERVEGMPFEALVGQRIAAPLGMPDTFIVPTAEQATRLVSGYEDGVLQPYFPNQMQAAGALKSSLADMLAYARWQLAERDPAVRLSHQPLDRAGRYVGGLNWQIVSAGGRRVLFQDGSHPGFACLLVLHPGSGIAIVLLSNEIDRDTMGRLRVLANGIGQALDAGIVVVP